MRTHIEREVDMTRYRLRSFGICLFGLLVVVAVHVTVVAAQEVRLVMGTGVSPADLVEGSHPTPGTVIAADADTIVVLVNEWSIDDGRCQDWVIIRGAQHRVFRPRSRDCPTRGNGDEFAQAAAGRVGVGQITASVPLFASDPKADDPRAASEPKLERLYSDLRRAEDGELPALRPAPTRRPSQRAEDGESPVSRPAPTRRASQIHARHNPSACLHRKFNNWENGNPVHLWACNAGASSMSEWVYDARTGYIRSAANPAKCWHKERSDWANGNRIHLWDCNAGGAAQKTWTVDPQNGYIRARENQRKCIHKKEGGFANGNPIHLWDCDAGVAQFKTWTMTVR